MRFSRWAGGFLASVLIAAAVLAQDASSSQKTLRTLVTTHEAHSLTLEEAARAYPVHLRAVVTYYDPYIDPRHAALFVHDETVGIFIMIPSQPILPMNAGTVVDVVGVSGNGDYAPIITRAKVRVVGKSHVPRQAIKASMAQLQSGAVDGQWVEIEGVVHSVHLTAGDATLDIASTGGPISATTPRETGVDYGKFVDSKIRIHGNTGPVFDRKYQMVGVHLLFPSLQELTVVQTAPLDPFAIPARSVSQLLRYTPGLELARRVRVQGRVTLQWPGRMLCIQQGSDGLCLQTTQAAPVRTGDLVDVIGFPVIGEFKATLEDATFRQAAGGDSQPAAKLISATQAFQGDHDSELVQIEGELIGQDHATGDLTLMLHSGNFLFPAILPRNIIVSGTLPWREGSILRLTGICSVQVDPVSTNLGAGGIETGTVRILLRSLTDVQVLRAPSWWTQTRVLEILVAVITLTFAAFAWIVVLRRRVRQQTQALRSSEEWLRHLSEHDALTNLPNRILLNDRLTMALQRAERFQERLGLLMVDVDRFKEVNDTYGHQAGDKLLCELAKRISHSVRLTDTVARFGGDEFLILLPDLHTREEAQSIAAKIVAAVSLPFHIGPSKLPIPVTVSVGVCTYPEAGLDMGTLLEHVDSAMYCVKENGRNGFEVYKPKGCEAN
jgi:diguanylate cyclase (GGDEF)-like protein